jgi:hypothetical protein
LHHWQEITEMSNASKKDLADWNTIAQVYAQSTGGFETVFTRNSNMFCGNR